VPEPGFGPRSKSRQVAVSGADAGSPRLARKISIFSPEVAWRTGPGPNKARAIVAAKEACLDVALIEKESR